MFVSFQEPHTIVDCPILSPERYKELSDEFAELFAEYHKRRLTQEELDRWDCLTNLISRHDYELNIGNKANLKEAFQELMGSAGDDYLMEILTTGKLSDASHLRIKDNIKYNTKDSIIKHYGLVYWYAVRA